MLISIFIIIFNKWATFLEGGILSGHTMFNLKGSSILTISELLCCSFGSWHTRLTDGRCSICSMKLEDHKNSSTLQDFKLVNMWLLPEISHCVIDYTFSLCQILWRVSTPERFSDLHFMVYPLLTYRIHLNHLYIRLNVPCIYNCYRLYIPFVRTTTAKK